MSFRHVCVWCDQVFRRVKRVNQSSPVPLSFSYTSPLRPSYNDAKRCALCPRARRHWRACAVGRQAHFHCMSCSSARVLVTYTLFSYSLPRSRHPSSSNSPTTGLSDGLLQRPRRRHQLVVRLSATSVNGRSRSLQSLSLTVTSVSSQRPRLPTTPSLLPLKRPSTSRPSLSSSNTKSSIKRAVTAVVVTSSFSRMASRPAARSFQTPRRG